MKRILVAAVVLSALPAVAQAQSSLFTPNYQPFPGVYVGAQGGLNWLLNSNNYNMDLGYAVGGVVGYDFVGPRVELEGMFRSNNGRGTANFGNVFSNTSGRIEQLSAMANVLYDFLPGARSHPISAPAPASHSSTPASTVARCAAPSSPIRASSAWAGTSTRTSASISMAATTAPPTFRRRPARTQNNNIQRDAGSDLQVRCTRPSWRRRRLRLWRRRRASWCSSTGTVRTCRHQALGTIQQAANAYKTKGNARITATGHTDTTGPESYNMALSLRRANTVKDALVRDGVPATAISVIGKGETQLLVQTGDGVREPQNRRVEIVIQ